MKTINEGAQQGFLVIMVILFPVLYENLKTKQNIDMFNINILFNYVNLLSSTEKPEIQHFYW